MSVPKSRILEVFQRQLIEQGYPEDRVPELVKVGYLAGGIAVETAKHQVRGNLRLLPSLNEEWPAFRLALQISTVKFAEEGVIADAADPLARKIRSGAAELRADVADSAYRRALIDIARGHNDPRQLALDTLAGGAT